MALRPRPLQHALLTATLIASAWTHAALAEEPATAATPKPAAAETSAPASPVAREEAAQGDAKKREAEAEQRGDAGLARRLAALSARWVRVIEALQKAAELEAQASKLEDERVGIQEQTDRMVTLLEQTEARRARALARLQELGLEPRGVSAPPAEAPTPAAETSAPAPGGAK